MLQVFRESIGRYVAIAILALIAVTFVFFGIDFSITQTTEAARVNGEPIPLTDFTRQLRQEQLRRQQVAQDELTDDQLRAVRRQVVDQLIARELLLQRAEEAGYRVSDARVADYIRNDPLFQAGGSFSEDVYLSLLIQEQLTPAGWEARERERLTVVDWQNGLLESSFVTPAELRRLIELYYERREIAWVLFAADDFRDQVEIDAEAVAAYHAENEAAFLTEEAVDIELIELDLASIAETIEVSEQDVRDYYEAEIERYAQSEERRVRHILIEPEGEDYATAEAEAAEVLERLEAGEDFAALAAEVSDDAGTRNNGGDLGWMARGTLTGPFEDALFSMEVGDTEGPVETEFGYHILRLDDVRASDPQPFEAVSDQLELDLASDRAYSQFAETANSLANDVFDARDDLASVAETYDGIEVETIEGLTRSNASERFVNPAPVIEAAFDDDAIETGENSDLLQLGEERVVFLRVRAHHPPEPRSLETVEAEVRELLEQEAAAALAREAATAFTEMLEAGTGEEPAADGAGPDVAEATDEATDAEADETDVAEADDAEAEAADGIDAADGAGDDVPDGDTAEPEQSEESAGLLARAEALADEGPGIWNAPRWIERDTLTVSPVIVSLVFSQPPPDDGEPAIVRASVGDGDEAVILLTRVAPGRPEDVPVAEREQWQQQLATMMVEAEINAFAADALEDARISIPDEVLDPDF